MKNGNNLEEKNANFNSYAKGWWRKRSTMERRLIFASIIFLSLLIIAIVVYMVFADRNKVCTNSSCVRTAMELMNYVDTKVSPCEDFYRFSCGQFLANTNFDSLGGQSRSVQDVMKEEIQAKLRSYLDKPENLTNIENTTPNQPTAFNLAKKFYKACMNENAIESEGLVWMKQVLNKMGGWPTLEGNNWNEKDFDWKNAIHKLRNIGINFEFFIILSMEKDKKNPHKYILTLEDPHYSPSKISQDIQDHYLNYMEDVSKLFGANKDIARREHREVLNLLLELAKISEDAAALNDTKEYNPLALSELQYSYQSINWFNFIDGLLYPASKVSYDDVVSVKNPLYLKQLEYILRTTSKRVIANFMAWHTVQHLINFLPASVMEKAYEYLDKVNGKMSRKPRWSMCVETVKERMGPVVSAIFIENNFDQEAKKIVMEIVQNIKIQFKFNLFNLEWLDLKTKSMAVENLLTTVEEYVSFDDLLQSIQETRVYESTLIWEDNFLMSALNLDLVNINNKFGKLHEVPHENWIDDPFFVTGLKIKLEPHEKILRFPVGLLSGIFFQKDRPMYMNYGSLGTIIAHEIWHAFMQSEYRTQKGELRSLWTPSALLNYEEKLQCLSRHYQHLSQVDHSGLHLNTSSTREEDMADLTGMKIAYDTYVQWTEQNGIEPTLPGLTYTPNQLFWISSSLRHCNKLIVDGVDSKHSPGRYRVNGPLKELTEFAYDFNCHFGDQMNSLEKCNLW